MVAVTEWYRGLPKENGKDGGYAFNWHGIPDQDKPPAMTRTMTRTFTIASSR